MKQSRPDLVRIYHCERRDDGVVEYVIEEKLKIQRKLRKCESAEMMELYGRQMVELLERSVLAQTPQFPV